MSSIAELVRQSIENLYQILDELKRTELNQSELKFAEFPKRAVEICQGTNAKEPVFSEIEKRR